MTGQPRLRATRRRFFLLGLAPVGVALLQACSSSSAPAPTSAPAPAATAAPAQASTAAPAQLAAPSKEGAKVTLELMAWTYAIDVVKDNLKQFEAMNPGVTVSESDSAWGNYHDAVVTRFAAGGHAPDVLYSSDHWLQEWAAAGWIIPAQDHFPKVTEYKSDLAPFVLEGLTYQGKMYGLPYYADLIGFIYNGKHLKDAGIAAAPKTWDEILEQSRTIKQKKIVNYAISAGLSQSDPFSIEILEAMAFSRGGEIFDKDLNPAFDKPGSALGQAADFVRTGIAEKLFDPQSLQNDMNTNIKAVGAGTHSFTVARLTALSNFNNPNESPAAGNFRMAMMPGRTSKTTGYVRFYAMSNALLKRDKAAQDAAWNLMEFLGGKVNGEYGIAKRWSIDKGIGFGQLSLFDDKDIKASWGKWVDLDQLKQQFSKSRVKAGLTPWFASWDIFTRAEIQKAYLGSEPTDAVMKSLADRWNQLKSEAKK